MSGIDFKQKINYQRPFSKPQTAEDGYDVVRKFESDRGRIINSAAIRRLQQKTQVFPLERNAAVRSRLTHSLEVQQVGRYIVKEIFWRLQKDKRLAGLGLEQVQAPIESLVEMSCLMHDIGNPPFGHFGEAAINDWFARQLDSKRQTSSISDEADLCQIACLRLRDGEPQLNRLRRQIRQDLSHFEGNAQAIRLVHTLLKLNLTYAQVACILKYTRPAYWLEEDVQPEHHDYLMKKPGYYLAEQAFVARMRQEVKMGEFDRFPLTYIMEAADDISYCIADLEDAVEKEIFSVSQLYDYLQQEWDSTGEKDNRDLFERIVTRAFNDSNSAGNRRSRDDEFFMKLRVNTIAKLVPHAVQRFIDYLPAIYDGTLNQALLEDNTAEYRLLCTFKSVAFKHVFNHPEVEQLELQGFRIMKGLLDIYHPLLTMPMREFERLVNDNSHPRYLIETRLFHKLSTKHRLAYIEATKNLTKMAESEKEIWEWYYRARLLQDYISGMTDLYAYDEYRRLMAAE